MTIGEFIPIIENQIVEGRLAEAAKDIAQFCSGSPDVASKARFEYIRKEALNIQGRLNRIKQADNQGTVSFDNQTLTINQGRVALLELVKILKDPTYSPAGLENSNWNRTSKRIGLVAIAIYGLFSIAVLIGVIFVFRFIWNMGLKDIVQESKQPTEVITHPVDCYLTTGHFTTLYLKPEIGSPSLGELPWEKQYKVLEVRKIRVMIGAPYEYYFKIHDDDKNWSGWIKQVPMDMEITPSCYEE